LSFFRQSLSLSFQDERAQTNKTGHAPLKTRQDKIRKRRRKEKKTKEEKTRQDKTAQYTTIYWKRSEERSLVLGREKETKTY
jgi:hypothetical protein